MTTNFGDLDNFTDDEELLVDRSFEEWARHVVAKAQVLAEEDDVCRVSLRPTMPVFQGEPWR